MTGPEVTFFMLVTPRDLVIADFAVKSYRKVKGLDFQLAVYSNYLLPEQKAYYFPRWEQYPYVTVIRNDHHDREFEAIRQRIDAEKLEGPYEYCDPVWDRELPKFHTPYVATVDADFEILGQDFVHHMMRRLRAEPKLIGFSTDYSPKDLFYEPYNKHTIILNERNHTWFCIYKREAFDLTNVSHAFHREMLPPGSGPADRNCWDSCAYFQKSLRDQGLEFDFLHGRFRRQFIHYGAFSKNTTITRENVRVFRAFALLENALPWRVARLVKEARRRLLPALENNRYELVPLAPIKW